MLPLALARRTASAGRSHRRAWPAAALLGALLALAAFSGTTAPLPRAAPPDALEFSLGGFGADGRTVKLRGDTVLFWRTPWSRPQVAGDTVRVVPTPDAWRAFWTAAEQAGVRRWRERYVAENVLDGTGWSLRLEDGDTVIESTGSNAYPDRQGDEHEFDMTHDFRAFMDALGELVGERL